MLLGVSLADEQWGKAAERAATIAAAFGGFCVAAALFRGDNGDRPVRRRMAGLVAAALALLASFSGHAPADVVVLATALALANSAYRHFGRTSVNIGFLTGDLQSLALALFGGKPRGGEARIVPTIFVFYVAGGAATALFAKHLAHPLLPAAAALLLFAAGPFGATSGASRRAR